MRKFATLLLLALGLQGLTQVSIWAIPGVPVSEVRAEVLPDGTAAFVWDASISFESLGSWSNREYSNGAGPVVLRDITAAGQSIYAVGGQTILEHERPAIIRLDATYAADSIIRLEGDPVIGEGSLTAASGYYSWGRKHYQEGLDPTVVFDGVSYGVAPGALTSVSCSIHPRRLEFRHAEGAWAVGSYADAAAFMWIIDEGAAQTDSLRLPNTVGSLEDISPDHSTMCGWASISGGPRCGIVIHGTESYSLLTFAGHDAVLRSCYGGYLVGSYDGHPLVVDQFLNAWVLPEEGECLRVREVGGETVIASRVGGSLRTDREFPQPCWGNVPGPTWLVHNEQFPPALTATQMVLLNSTFVGGEASALGAGSVPGSTLCSTGLGEQGSHRDSSPISELMAVDGRVVRVGGDVRGLHGLFLVRRGASCRLEYVGVP
jgi:hypothetical protein